MLLLVLKIKLNHNHKLQNFNHIIFKKKSYFNISLKNYSQYIRLRIFLLKKNYFHTSLRIYSHSVLFKYILQGHHSDPICRFAVVPFSTLAVQCVNKVPSHYDNIRLFRVCRIRIHPSQVNKNQELNTHFTRCYKLESLIISNINIFLIP